MILSKERIETWFEACEDNNSEILLLTSHEELRAQRDEAVRLLCQACTIPDGVGEFLAKLAT